MICGKLSGISIREYIYADVKPGSDLNMVMVMVNGKRMPDG